jgi:hypothetical protein
VQRSTLENHVRKVLGVKHDLGLFENRYIPDDIDPMALTASHLPLTLEAAHKSIVLLENRNTTLPINPSQQNISSIALIGPYIDTLNYGDYSGQWGSTPTENSTTLRKAMSTYLVANNPDITLTSSWGANTWLYNAQYNIPIDLLSSNGVAGDLLGTYYADTNFSQPIFQKQEAPNRDWGFYPLPGLPSNNFSVIWEGELLSPTESEIDGWIGVAKNANISAKLYVNGELAVSSTASLTSSILGNIEPFAFSTLNGTQAPIGSIPFTFSGGVSYTIRLELQVWNYV